MHTHADAMGYLHPPTIYPFTTITLPLTPYGVYTRAQKTTNQVLQIILLLRCSILRIGMRCVVVISLFVDFSLFRSQFTLWIKYHYYPMSFGKRYTVIL